MRVKLFAWVQTPWVIAVVALLLRLAWLGYKISVIPRDVLATAPFENEVGNVASALVDGHGFCCLFRQATGPTAWLGPVYPFLLAAVFKLFGTFTFGSFCAAVFVNSLFSALACFPLFSAGLRVCGKFTAVLACWLWALAPVAIILPYAWIWDTSLSAFLAVVLLWATLVLPERPTVFAFAVYGLLWGISLLTNPALGAVLPFLLAWALRCAKSTKRQRLQRVLACSAVVLFICLPWTIRNYVQFHRFIPLRSNFAYEFWSGNNPIFDPDSRETNRITRYEQTRRYAEVGESVFLHEKWQAAERFVRMQPALYGHLCARRIIATWCGTDSPWYDFVHADSWVAQVLLVSNLLSLPLGVGGLLCLYRVRRPLFVPIAAFPIIFPVTFYLTHTSLRHRHPCDPAVALLTAIALVFLRGTNRADIG